MASQWPEGQLDHVIVLWRDGKSASEAATITNAKFGTRHTRNAVIGQIHRHAPDELWRVRTHARASMSANKRKRILRPRPSGPKMSPQKAALAELMASQTPLPPSSATDIARVSFNDLEDGRHCKFIPGDPMDNFKPDKPLYCGAKPVPGLKWCADHAVRCHNPPALKIRVTVKAPEKEFA